MKLVVKDIKKETNDAVSVFFKNGNFFNKVKYKPGQFLTLHVPINNKVEKRSYSFSSNPYTDKDLKITVKQVDKGLVSNFICQNLKIGDALEIDKPQGSFYVEPKINEEKQYVLFAGGSGITPVFSIVKSILTKEPKSKVLLIYANRDKESIIFHQEILALKETYFNTFNVDHILANNNEPNENYHEGLATRDLYDKILNKYHINFENNVYMICGPFGFMEKTKEILTNNNVKPNEIIVEVFKKPKVKVSGNDFISNVEINFNGTAYQIQVPGDKSILRVAMANNIALPYSCRSGVCSTCKAVCVSGEIEMTAGHFLSQPEVDKGSILTCISYPKSKKITINL
ncbi:ferredoxin--NADP reductase [Mariniflexile soesokkakense]|uniref:Ferredoxin--NADP reductase n=1 Tax=Mariniflexile soesokkakense TaxID=1343160 RepID=A0ABV0AE77_9FLAO